VSVAKQGCTSAW